jgi:hypothetical protein
MKIYTEVNYTWSEEKGELIQTSSKSYEYNGPMSLCHDKFEYIGPKKFNNKIRIPHGHQFDQPDPGPVDDPSEQAATEAALLDTKKGDARADLEAAFSGYGLEDADSHYFKKIGRNYRDFAMNAPVTGIKDQRKAAMGDLIAQLARQGQLDSTTRVDREALSKKLFAKAQVDASAKGHGIGEGVRQNLLGAKGQGLADINAATDPSSAANFAINNITAQTDPGTFDPMLDVFYELTKGLAMRQETENRKKQQGQLDSLFSHSSSAKNIG